MGINIRTVEQLTPERYDRTYPGTVVKVGTDYKVNVLGNVITARWSDPVVVSEGDSVLVQFVMARTGLSEAIIRARVGNLARPARATVTVVPVSSPTVSVQGTDGRTYTATFVTSYTPVVGDEVLLSWNASTPSIQGKIAATAAPPVPAPPPAPPIAPPPPPPQTGRATYWATQSNTYWAPGGWGSWAGGRGRVYQGSYGTGPVYGGWFYGGGPTQLQGRSIDYVGFTLGNRINAGSWSSPVTVHFYATDAMNQPGGLYTAVAGPVDAVANAGQGLTEYNLTAFAGHLLNGGGIGIFGEPYAGFLGRNEQADSGRLFIDWRM